MLYFHFNQANLSLKVKVIEDHLYKLAIKELRAWTLSERVKGLLLAKLAEIIVEEATRDANF
jgi:hypothetical protein